jgi:hypothetical protein
MEGSPFLPLPEGMLIDQVQITEIGRGNLVDMAEVHQFPDCLTLLGLDHLLIISLNLHLACKAQVCAIHPSKSCHPGLDAW